MKITSFLPFFLVSRLLQETKGTKHDLPSVFELVKNQYNDNVIVNNNIFQKKKRLGRKILQSWSFAFIQGTLCSTEKIGIGKDTELIQTTSLGCKSHPSLRILKYLGRICEDCYNIYRNADVFQMCRQEMNS